MHSTHLNDLLAARPRLRQEQRTEDKASMSNIAADLSYVPSNWYALDYSQYYGDEWQLLASEPDLLAAAHGEE